MAVSKKAVRAAAVKKTAKSSPKVAATPKVPKREEDRWRAEDDARTLMRAEEIKRDRARMAKARAVAKKQISELSKVAKA